MFTRKMRYGFTAVSGLLLLINFPPVNLECLAWITLVPWLVAVYSESNLKRTGRLPTVFGFCLFPMFYARVIRYLEIMALDYEAKGNSRDKDVVRIRISGK
jgi:apolipoprotein N-acyltransferase